MKSPKTPRDFPIAYLKDASAWISFAHDLNHLLELILETGTKIMNARASSLLLLDRKTNKLHFRVATGEKKEAVKHFAVKLGQGIAGQVAQTGIPLLISDASEDSRWYGHISEKIGFVTRSIICAPLKVEDTIIGAIEFINKDGGGPFRKNDLDLLCVFADLAALAIVNARKFQQVERENRRLQQVLDTTHTIIGESRAIKQVISDALKVAQSNAVTMIMGESGTGKELLARLIHYSSPRRQRSMVALNCAALQETLLEDELFGHEKGAFTDAAAKKIGKFELADESTIFFDEIGEMSPSMQAKLLRVLQDGVFYRVGGNLPISVNVRILSATNKNIRKEIAEGRFREDLYYRLNVVSLSIPPLRERKEDIPLLAKHFADMFMRERAGKEAVISTAAMEKMMHYDWPGNIREMKNIIERAVVMGSGTTIRPEDLTMPGKKIRTLHAMPSGKTLREAVDTFKKNYIASQLHAANGNQKQAARTLGIQRTYLSRLIAQYRLKEENPSRNSN
ncbi:MAG: sigma 54-interacting transcriptional regulator [Desulfobacterales bacterium]